MKKASELLKKNEQRCLSSMRGYRKPNYLEKSSMTFISIV
jgi:hypothetical protein